MKPIYLLQITLFFARIVHGQSVRLVFVCGRVVPHQAIKMAATAWDAGTVRSTPQQLNRAQGGFSRELLSRPVAQRKFTLFLREFREGGEYIYRCGICVTQTPCAGGCMPPN